MKRLTPRWVLADPLRIRAWRISPVRGPRGQDRVVAELLGVPVGGTVLLLVADLVDGRVDIDDEALVTWSRAERPGGGERLTDHLFQLADMAEGERPQERAQRGRRHHLVLEHLCGRSCAQHVGMVDVAGAGHHGVHQRQDLPSRPEPANPPRVVDRGVAEPLEPKTLGQRGDEHQAGAGHQVRLVEGHCNPVDPARYWSQRKCLLCWWEALRRTQLFSQPRGPFWWMRGHVLPVATRWIEA